MEKVLRISCDILTGFCLGALVCIGLLNALWLIWGIELPYSEAQNGMLTIHFLVSGLLAFALPGLFKHLWRYELIFVSSLNRWRRLTLSISWITALGAFVHLALNIGNLPSAENLELHLVELFPATGIQIFLFGISSVLSLSFTRGRIAQTTPPC